MRTIKKVFDVYNYDELSEEAKEKVKEWYLNDDCRTDVFSDMCNGDLKNLFDGDLKVQYSLSCSQGDGLNIYGTLYAENIIKCLELHNGGTQLEEFENALTEKEKRIILCYAKECGKIDLPINRHYCYSIADRIDIVNEWMYTLENYSCFKNINVEVLKKFEELVRKIFSKVSKSYEKDGYEFFYEVDEDVLLEECKINEWEFYKDGTFYAA